MNLKKYLIIFSIAILTLLAPKVFSAEPVLNVILPSSNFLDIPNEHWAYAEIKELHRLGIVTGYPNDKFHPDNPVSREEFITIAIKALGLNDMEVRSLKMKH